jgi:sterol desaturase/sphingolipid hydroxylase (fatty acid hydroxylase superfamily)
MGLMVFTAASWAHHNILGDAGLDQLDLPVAVLFGVGVLLADFLRYWSHRVRHRWTWFWRFHEVHHAQTRLNPFTEHRVHPMEYVHHWLFFAIPLALAGVNWATGWLFFSTAAVHTRLYHAPIRTRYGPLRWILVTPQSHRIHHSTAAEHHDKNFGVLLSIWDRMFGTAHPDEDSYPQVGVDDARWPVGGHGLRAVPKEVASQVVYPFLSRSATDNASVSG